MKKRVSIGAALVLGYLFFSASSHAQQVPDHAPATIGQPKVTGGKNAELYIYVPITTGNLTTGCQARVTRDGKVVASESRVIHADDTDGIVFSFVCIPPDEYLVQVEVCNSLNNAAPIKKEFLLIKEN